MKTDSDGLQPCDGKKGEDESMNQIDLAWAAGFIDGEGCVSVVRCTHAGVRREQVQVLLDVGQAKPAPLQHLADLFGGRVRLTNAGKGSYGWRLYGRKAGVVLGAVLPYLVVKRRQAELCLELIAQQGSPGQFRAEATYARSLAISAELRVLNYRRPRHAERLSESAPARDGAIVRTHGKVNRESAAEMTAPLRLVAEG